MRFVDWRVEVINLLEVSYCSTEGLFVLLFPTESSGDTGSRVCF